jgi:dTDP-4-dehydrorhamnose 3,5-epimerase-like enzyme
MLNRSYLVRGGARTDDRGTVSFVWLDPPHQIARMYWVRQHSSSGQVRAWHGHKKERKYITVVQGAAKIVAIHPSGEFGNPDRDTESKSEYVLSGECPDLVCIPGGNYNGIRWLAKGTIVLVLSTMGIAESIECNDDYRLPWDYWDVWDIVQR